MTQVDMACPKPPWLAYVLSFQLLETVALKGRMEGNVLFNNSLTVDLLRLTPVALSESIQSSDNDSKYIPKHTASINVFSQVYV